MTAYLPPKPEQLKTSRGRTRAEAKVIKYWPDARERLQALQKRLENDKIGITAAQVSMALQLAEINFARRARRRAPREKRWTDAQLREMWPQSHGELLSYSWSWTLRLNRELALSLNMALMLAQNEFCRMKK